MSRMSLRRQMFYKNIDMLLQSSSLQTVEEEFHDDSGHNKVAKDSSSHVSCDQPSVSERSDSSEENKLLLTQPKKFSLVTDYGSDSQQHTVTEETNTCRSPIYKPNKMVNNNVGAAASDSGAGNQSNNRNAGAAASDSGGGNQSIDRTVIPSFPYTDLDETSVVELPKDGTPYTDLDESVLGNCSKEKLVRAGTIYTEIDESIGGNHSKERLVRPGSPYTEIDELVGGNHSKERLVRPGTPYTEIDESKVGLNKKAVPLKFKFESTKELTTDVNNNKSRNYPESLPFSPIPRDGMTDSRIITEDNCKSSSHHADQVRALPMSPAAYARTSTPGPASLKTNAQLCKTIAEENIFSFNEGNMCRICHEGEEEEELVSPCHCAGTMGMLHISCLEQWLGSSKTTKCEICQFQFTVLKKPQSMNWYLREPSLLVERRLMVRDIVVIVCLGLFVLLGSILSIVYSKKLQNQDQHVGASLLIVFPTAGIILYAGFLIFALYKIRQRFKAWIKEHHVIQITQGNTKQNTSNKIFRRFTYPQSKKKKHPLGAGILSHLDPFLARFSLESYKAAMYNPILPNIPEHCGIEGIEVHTNSSSVISLDEDDDEESHVSYYQPPEPGSTSILYNETGKLLRETGV